MRAPLLIAACLALASCDNAKLKTPEALQSECWDRCEALPSGAWICSRSTYRPGGKMLVPMREAAILDAKATTVCQP